MDEPKRKVSDLLREMKKLKLPVQTLYLLAQRQQLLNQADLLRAAGSQPGSCGKFHQNATDSEALAQRITDFIENGE